MNYYQTPEYLRIKASMNRKYAEANRETFARTNGKGGSLYMADIHDACAEIAEKQALEVNE